MGPNATPSPGSDQGSRAGHSLRSPRSPRSPQPTPTHAPHTNTTHPGQQGSRAGHTHSDQGPGLHDSDQAPGHRYRGLPSEPLVQNFQFILNELKPRARQAPRRRWTKTSYPRLRPMFT